MTEDENVILTDLAKKACENNDEMEEYKNYMARRKSRHNTINRHISRLVHLKRLFDVTNLLDVRNREQITQIIDRINNKNSATQNAYFSTIKSFYYEFWLDKYQGKPMPLIALKDSNLVHQPITPRVVVFTQAHLQVFRDVCQMNREGKPPLPEEEGKHIAKNGPLVGVFFELQLDAGMRLGEVIWSSKDSHKKVEKDKNNPEDVYFFHVHNYEHAGKTIKFYTRDKEHGKDKTVNTKEYLIKYSLKRTEINLSRKPTISKHTYDMLNWYIENVRPQPCDPKLSDLLFLDNRIVQEAFGRGTKETDNWGGVIPHQRMDELFKDLMNECDHVATQRKLKISFSKFVAHDLRATFCTRHLLNNVPASVCATWMGDKVSSIDSYCRFVEDELRRKNYRSAVEN